MERHELTSERVRELVLEALDLIREVRDGRGLPLCPRIEETRRRLARGVFRAEEIPYERRRNSFYALSYSYFEPPSTITLDKRRPFWDRPLDLPELVETATYYCVVHEVIHADDYMNGNRVIKETMRHIEEAHEDKLRISMRWLRRSGAPDYIKRKETLLRIWAEQYADMITHYRTYVVLRERKFPKVDYIWACLYSNYFPPHILTAIERERGVDYVLRRITEDLGRYCLVEALREAEEISRKKARRYTV